MLTSRYANIPLEELTILAEQDKSSLAWALVEKFNEELASLEKTCSEESYEQGHEEGYKAGYLDGYEIGSEEGFDQGVESTK